jgi:hypothetical protein
MAHSHSDHANIDTLLQKTGSAVAVARTPYRRLLLHELQLRGWLGDEQEAWLAASAGSSRLTPRSLVWRRHGGARSLDPDLG